jgi:hypothetical protein
MPFPSPGRTSQPSLGWLQFRCFGVGDMANRCYRITFQVCEFLSLGFGVSVGTDGLTDAMCNDRSFVESLSELKPAHDLPKRIRLLRYK